MIIMSVQKETKINQRNTNQFFRGGGYEEGVIQFQADKMDPMSKIYVTKSLLGVVMTQQYSLNVGLKKLEMIERP